MSEVNEMTEMTEMTEMNDMSEILRGIVADVAQVASGDLAADTVLEELDQWDSLALVQIIAELEDALAVSLPFEDLSGVKTYGDLAALVDTAPV
ncbi:MAG: acyl carrier protein [Actinomycetes bacterium]|jgi:acyl carrier protein|nr:acyl carrier protein [Actinomycetes bacterium]